MELEDTDLAVRIHGAHWCSDPSSGEGSAAFRLVGFDRVGGRARLDFEIFAGSCAPTGRAHVEIVLTGVEAVHSVPGGMCIEGRGTVDEMRSVRLVPDVEGRRAIGVEALDAPQRIRDFDMLDGWAEEVRDRGLWLPLLEAFDPHMAEWRLCHEVESGADWRPPPPARPSGFPNVDLDPEAQLAGALLLMDAEFRERREVIHADGRVANIAVWLASHGRRERVLSELTARVDHLGAGTPETSIALARLVICDDPGVADQLIQRVSAHPRFGAWWADEIRKWRGDV